MPIFDQNHDRPEGQWKQEGGTGKLNVFFKLML